MYLPSNCSFRMTDIWRGFIAQRCLWEMGGAVAFHAPEAVQDRNPHDLQKDFADEVPGYLRNDEIKCILCALKLGKYPDKNLVQCYEALVEARIFPVDELQLVDFWLRDIGMIKP